MSCWITTHTNKWVWDNAYFCYKIETPSFKSCLFSTYSMPFSVLLLGRLWLWWLYCIPPSLIDRWACPQTAQLCKIFMWLLLCYAQSLLHEVFHQGGFFTTAPPGKPIREMQIKTTMSYHLTSIRMAISSKSLQTINAGECVEEKEPSYCYVNWYNRYGEQYGGPLKTKTTIWSSNLIPGWVWMCVCRYIHSNVQCSSIYSSQDLETTYISIYRGMDKEDVCGTCIQ